MRINDLKDKEGRIFAFEVSAIGRRRVCRLVQSITEVKLIKIPSSFSYFREAEFCEFELAGQNFVIGEPFGGRCWVGPEPPRWCPQLETVRSAFMQFRP